MPRALDNWLASYLHYTRHDEAAEAFHRWTGLTLLAVAANRNVWMSRGYYRTYPNLYTLFVGPSGIGKSTASGIGISLLDEASLPVKVFRDSITPAALLEFMARALYVEEKGNIVIEKTPVLIYASELGNLLSSRTGVRELTLLLTELFTKQGNHRDTTIKRDKKIIVKPVVSFLGCCFPQWLAEELPSSSLRSGFLGRMFVTTADKKRHLNPEVELDVSDHELRGSLVSDLNHIGSLYGEMRFSDDARDLWKEFYMGLPTDFSQFEADVEGFHSRQAAFAQRLAMLLSLSMGDNLVIEIGALAAALSYVEECEKNMERVNAGPAHHQNIVRLSRLIKRRGIVEYCMLVRWTSKYMNKMEREAALEDLAGMGAIKWVPSAGGRGKSRIKWVEEEEEEGPKQ